MFIVYSVFIFSSFQVKRQRDKNLFIKVKVQYKIICSSTHTSYCNLLFFNDNRMNFSAVTRNIILSPHFYFFAEKSQRLDVEQNLKLADVLKIVRSLDKRLLCECTANVTRFTQFIQQFLGRNLYAFVCNYVHLQIQPYRRYVLHLATITFFCNSYGICVFTNLSILFGHAAFS